MPYEIIYLIKYLCNYVDSTLWFILLKYKGLSNILYLTDKSLIESYKLLLESISIGESIINEHHNNINKFMKRDDSPSFITSPMFNVRMENFVFNELDLTFDDIVYDCHKNIIVNIIIDPYYCGSCRYLIKRGKKRESVSVINTVVATKKLLMDCTIKFIYYLNNYQINKYSDIKQFISYCDYYK